MKAESKLELMRSYRRCMTQDDGTLSPDGRAVMADLEAFCNSLRGTLRVDSTGRADPIQTAIEEGKRLAFLRVRAMLFAPLDDVIRKTEGKT